jgi:NADH dehydrogenase
LIHRGYHVLAIPTWERKIRVLAVWLTAVVFGRDIASLESAQHPRAAFLSGGEPDSSCSQSPVTVLPAKQGPTVATKAVKSIIGAQSTR